jgi:hypothetical protein
MILLGICIFALLIGGLRLATEQTPLPTGSSYSPQPDGARALYTWAEAVGSSPWRLQDAQLRNDRLPATLVVLQPEAVVDQTARDAFEAVPRSGGTLIVAGDSVAWLLYARNLGLTVEPIRTGAVTASDGRLTVPFRARFRLRSDGATPLLATPDGDVVAVRLPYQQGSAIVLASADPLTNAGLRNEPTARFVYREILSPAIGQTLAFDELHHSFAPVTAGPATVNQLLFGTSPGRAMIYAAVLTFLYLLLSGRRLGPALAARPPTETRRTMYEHVQMLANLYRRARQLPVVRAMFSRHYTRLLSRGGAGSPKRSASLAEAIARIEVARTEAELIAAVAAADDRPAA